MDMGVWPLFVALVMSAAAPTSNSHLHIDMWPFWQAINMGIALRTGEQAHSQSGGPRSVDGLDELPHQQLLLLAPRHETQRGAADFPGVPQPAVGRAVLLQRRNLRGQPGNQSQRGCCLVLEEAAVRLATAT